MTPELFAKYEDVVQDMLTEDGEMLRNSVQVVGKDGRIHELTLNQLDYFLDTMNGTLSSLERYNPLQYTVYHWQLKELLSNGNWLATQYTITFDIDEDSIVIDGTQVHKATVSTHPDYDPDINAPSKTFHHRIADVGVFGNMALVNCISKQAPELAVVAGSFGGSFVFQHKDGQLSLSSMVPVVATEADVPAVDPEI